MKKIVALNLKMNLDYEESLNYVKTINNKISDSHEVILFPSTIYLDLFKSTNYLLGIQNVYNINKGSYTGEISPLQAKTFGIKYALIGHSERRIHFKEDDILINQKVIASLSNNLKVILCIGETKEERTLKKTAVVLKKQLLANLKDIDQDLLKDVIIAYEPVWSIGTGKTLNQDDINDAIKYIKKVINEKFAYNPIVLYGGSVNKDNIKDIINMQEVNGVLVGSASLDPNYMLSMLDIIE